MLAVPFCGRLTEAMVSVSPDGPTVTYTPNAGFGGVDTFSYVVGNGKSSTAVGSISVQVIGSLFLPMVKR